MSLSRSIIAWSLSLSLLAPAGAAAQGGRRSRAASSAAAGGAGADARLTGVYRLDPAASDKLYSVVAGASTNLPYGEQQRFFIDLAVRLTPPDQFAIERRGRTITIASSRAPRMTFEADGLLHTERAADGRAVRTRAVLAGDQLNVTTSGGTDDRFSVSFEPIGGGERLLVTRRIQAEELNQPVVIRSVYRKVSEVARWEIYGEPERAPADSPALAARAERASSAYTGAASRPVANTAEGEAAALRRALDDWIAATNARDTERQMLFYAPTLRAFYLQRNVPRSAVRAEKERVFRRAGAVDIRAAAPEIVFVDSGRTAIMRFRKTYAIESGGQNRSGEVVQELRWQRAGGGWKIISERDIRVLR